MSIELKESFHWPPAKGTIRHRQPTRWICDDGSVLDTWDRAAPPAGGPDPSSYELLFEEEVTNVITNVGRDFLHTQSYGTSPASNGLNYIALSNDTVSETATSTTLTNEIAANGLTRAIGSVSHSAGATTTAIEKVFTCATSAQAAQKAALFTASSSGTMCHVLGFTQRSLQVGDQLDITFTITLS